MRIFSGLIIFVEKKFRKENIQFSSWSFFPFPETARRRADLCARILQNPQCLEKYICMGVTAVKNPEVPGSNPTVGHIFSFIFRYTLTHSYFLIPKNGVFSTKFRDF